jgi:gliding motility-associated-like protein
VVTITRAITPDFATTLTLCSTDTAPALATTSPNGITGTWSPAGISTTASGSYTFTPNLGQCGTTATLAVTITPAIKPNFSTTLTLCNNAVAPTLATTSPNGITGTWNPAIISTTANATYTFSPNAGQCATTTTLAVTINSFAYSITQDCIDNEYLIKVQAGPTNSSQDLTYTWVDQHGNQVGDNNSTFNFTSYIEKSLDKPMLPLQFKVIVGNGSCDTEETFVIKNNLCGLPNIITPNGDGINDSFDLTSFNVSKVLIFNRWGSEVFNFAGKYEDQWKGQWKEGTKLPTGTYFYLISNDNGDERASWVFLSY